MNTPDSARSAVVGEFVALDEGIILKTIQLTMKGMTEEQEEKLPHP